MDCTVFKEDSVYRRRLHDFSTGGSGLIYTKTSIPQPCFLTESCSAVDISDNKHIVKRPTPMNTGNTTNQLTELESWYHWIGYRVCISGVKEGVLRHFGPTQFADGLWCGVELDEPVGKNDGSVKGVRYFTCKENHGIFAPFSKTVKLPLESTCNRTDKDIQLPDEQRRFARKSKLPPPKIAVKNILSQKGMLQETFVQQVGEAESSIPVAYVTGSSRVNDNTDIFLKKNENNFEIPYKTRRLSEDGFKTNRIKNSYSCNFSNTNFMFGIPSKTSKRKGSLPINISYTVSANKKIEDNMHLNDFFNTTVTLDNNKSEICKSNSEHNTTFSINEDNPVLNTTFGLDSLLSVEENTENANEEQIFDRTFILEEPNCSVNHHDITLEKHALSEEDIVSLDFDDSLGILSPSQMKDFTLCTDQHSTVIDTNIVNIPKIESCDDINDLPEYEVAKDVSNLSPDDNSDSILHILPEQIFNASSVLAESGCSESKETKSVIHELHHTVDLSKNVVDENHSFETDIVQTSTPFNDNKMPVSNLSCISSPQLRNKEKMHFYTPIGTALKENVKKSRLDAIKCALMASEESNKCFSSHIENSNLSQIRDEKLPDIFNTLSKTSAECHPTMSNNLSFLLSSELNQQNKTALNPSASLCQDESLNDNIYTSADIANNLYDSQQLINVDLSNYEQQIAENETEKNTILQSSEICNVEFKTLLQQEKSDCFDFVSCKGNQLENIKNLQHLPDQFNQCVQIKEHASNEEFVNNDNRTEITNTIQSINVDHYDEKLDKENKLETSSHSHGNENVEQITQNFSISESQKNSLVKSDITDSDVFTDSGCIEMELNEIETIEDCHNMTFDISDTVNTRNREDLVIDDIECDSDKHQNDITETETNKTVIITNSDVCNTTITSMVLNKTFVDNQLNSTLVRPTTLEIGTKITNNKQNNSSVNIDESTVMNATICLSENQKIKNSSLNNLTHCVSSEQSFVTDENFENVSKSLSNVTSTSSSKSSPKRKQNLAKSNNVSNKNINTKVLEKKQLFDNRNMPVRTPKKNVISKIKEMLESSKNISTTDEENESLKKIIRTQKKAGRWNAVTSKIAAGLAEEKSKLKQKKEIASKIDTNLTAARQCVIKKSPKYNIVKSNKPSESTNNSNVTPVIKNLKNTFNNQRLIEVKEKKDSGEGLSREGRVLAQLQNVEYTAIKPKDDLRRKNTEQQDNVKNRNYSYPPHLPTPSSDSGSIQSLTSQVSSKQSTKIAVYQRGRVGSAGSSVSHSSKNVKQAPVITVGVRSRESSAKSIVRQSYAGKPSLPSDAAHSRTLPRRLTTFSKLQPPCQSVLKPTRHRF